jgi:hypothetical protein
MSRHGRIHFWFTIACRILKSRTGVTKRARAFSGITSTSLVFHRFRTDHQRVSVCAVRFHHHHGALVPGSTTSTLVVNIHGRWSGSHGSPLMRQGPSRATGTPPEFAPIFLHKALRTDGRTDEFQQRNKNLSHRTHGFVREPGRTGGFVPIPQPKQNDPQPLVGQGLTAERQMENQASARADLHGGGEDWWGVGIGDR